MSEDHSMATPETPQDVVAAQPVKRKRRWLWLIPLVVIGGAAFVYTQNQKSQAAAAKGRDRTPRAVPIATAPVKQGPIDVYITALGSVTPINTVTVTSRVQGQIMEVDYHEGQLVHKGEVLLRIDPRLYQAAVT